jgi:hypothetical protein
MLHNKQILHPHHLHQIQNRICFFDFKFSYDAHAIKLRIAAFLGTTILLLSRIVTFKYN